MGSASRLARHSPKRLGEKLLKIRQKLNLSQNELLSLMGQPESLQQSSINGYELGKRQVPLLILLKYAEVAHIFVDVLLDDAIDLPEEIPAKIKSAGNDYKK